MTGHRPDVTMGCRRHEKGPAYYPGETVHGAAGANNQCRQSRQWQQQPVATERSIAWAAP